MSQNPTATPVLPFALPAVASTPCGALTPRCSWTPTRLNPAPQCPACGQALVRVHSRYLRLVRDLPVVDRPVRLLLRVRRFFCDAPACPKRTFTERLPALVPYRARC